MTFEIVEIISFYAKSIVVAVLAALALGVFGLTQIPKKQGAALFAKTQFALIGVLVAHLLLEEDHHFAIVLASLFFYFVIESVLNLTKRRYRRSFTEYTLSIYLFGVAIVYFLTSYFPKLEGHMVANFFGDIVSLDDTGLWITGVASVGYLIYFWFFRRVIIRDLFEVSLGLPKKQWSQSPWYINMAEILFIVVMLYGLGFLYTISYLFIPAVIIGTFAVNFRKSIMMSLLVSGLSSFLGIGFSLIFSRVSTVPTQVCLLILIALSVQAVFLRRS